MRLKYICQIVFKDVKTLRCTISTHKTKPSIPFRKKHYRSRVNMVLIAGSLLHELDH